MSYRVIVSPEAEADLVAILDYVEERGGVLDAIAVEERLLAAVESLREQPERGRVVPILARRGVTAFRELIDSPWHILYRLVGKSVRVVAVVDERRRLEDLLWERTRR